MQVIHSLFSTRHDTQVSERIQIKSRENRKNISFAYTKKLWKLSYHKYPFNKYCLTDLLKE